MSSMTGHLAEPDFDLQEMGRDPVIVVTVLAAAGSTPREAGARMLVTTRSLQGTIGGGRLEWDAIAAARTMIADGRTVGAMTIPLGPSIGQCCGGRVTLDFRRLDRDLAAEIRSEQTRSKASRPRTVIYGAGHVGRALARAMALLPVRVTLIDSRQEELEREPLPGVELVAATSPADVVISVPAGAAHVVMTHSHALDSLVVAEVLARADFAYLGLIGSATKRETFRKALREIGFDDAALGRMRCPIGGSRLRDKRPAVIAAMVAAEIAEILLAGKPPIGR
jgi:xanthine dehydrogenase accessory factor